MNFHPRMTAKLAMALGLVAAIATASGFQTVQAQNIGSQRQTVAQHRQNGTGSQSERMGPRGDRHSGPRGPQFCEDGGNENHLDQMDTFLSANLDLSETQQANWGTVLDTFNSLEVEAACASGNRDAMRAMGEQMREPLHTFMDSLSDEQKDEIHGFMREQHERRRAEFEAPGGN